MNNMHFIVSGCFDIIFVKWIIINFGGFSILRAVCQRIFRDSQSYMSGFWLLLLWEKIIIGKKTDGILS